VFAIFTTLTDWRRGPDGTVKVTSYLLDGNKVVLRVRAPNDLHHPLCSCLLEAWRMPTLQCPWYPRTTSSRCQRAYWDYTLWCTRDACSVCIQISPPDINLADVQAMPRVLHAQSTSVGIDSQYIHVPGDWNASSNGENIATKHVHNEVVLGKIAKDYWTPNVT
jgi:hypothetical protein